MLGDDIAVKSVALSTHRNLGFTVAAILVFSVWNFACSMVYVDLLWVYYSLLNRP